jgi:carboxymethylenebutenolidase
MPGYVRATTLLAVDRRLFLVSSLTTGFALAVQPVRAETIKTDGAGLVEGEVKIGNMPAYRAMPDKGDKFPLVLVVQEIFGVHEHIKDVCRRLAKQGYVAIAPELFARQGDVSKMTDIGAILKDIVAKVPDEQVLRDLDDTVAWAKRSAKVDGSRVGITGFCWGGRIAWLYAARGTVKAAVAWYGRISGPPNTFQPRYPLDLAADIKVPVLGLSATRDHGIPVSHVELMRAALANGKSGSDIKLFDAEHGFHADYRPSYSEKAAKEGWQDALAWFKKHGL